MADKYLAIVLEDYLIGLEKLEGSTVKTEQAGTDYIISEWIVDGVSEPAEQEIETMTLEYLKKAKIEEALILMKAYFSTMPDAHDPQLTWDQLSLDDALIRDCKTIVVRINAIQNEIINAADLAALQTAITGLGDLDHHALFTKMLESRDDLISQYQDHKTAIEALTAVAEVEAYAISYAYTPIP